MDKSERTDGTFSRSEFTFDTERNLYVCPAGKERDRRRPKWADSAPPGVASGRIEFGRKSSFRCQREIGFIARLPHFPNHALIA